jgi:hypothetical protein
MIEGRMNMKGGGSFGSTTGFSLILFFLHQLAFKRGWKSGSLEGRETKDRDWGNGEMGKWGNGKGNCHIFLLLD